MWNIQYMHYKKTPEIPPIRMFFRLKYGLLLNHFCLSCLVFWGFLSLSGSLPAPACAGVTMVSFLTTTTAQSQQASEITGQAWLSERSFLSWASKTVLFLLVPSVWILFQAQINPNEFQHRGHTSGDNLATEKQKKCLCIIVIIWSSIRFWR